MRIFAMVGIAGVLAMGNAWAAECPEPSGISQETASQGGMDGITYRIKTTDGEWSAFSPDAKKAEADKFKLQGKKETTTSTICQYEIKEVRDAKNNVTVRGEGFNLVLKKK